MGWITTDDVLSEVWRRLLEFANLDITIESIIKRHGPALTKSTEQNYKKQAKRIIDFIEEGWRDVVEKKE